MNRTLLVFTYILIFLRISPSVMSQTSFNYESAWKKVESALEIGKPKTAIEEIDKIILQSKKDGNEPQQIKGLVYKAKASQQFEEDSQLKYIRIFEQEIKTAREPVKQVLFSLTAQLYKNYFDRQRWKIYDRTATTNPDPNNPDTWSIADFNERISTMFDKSLSNPVLLQKTDLKKFDPIILEGNMRHLRPTLYDLLAHEALEYWKNDEGEITRPVYAFVPDYASLAPAKIFLRNQYTSKDSTGHTFKAIRLYQELIRFHLADEKPDALIDVDVARIQFAYDKAVMPGKSQLYKEALEHIYTQYPKNEQAMQAGFHLAMWWFNKGENYKPATGTQEDKMAFGIALEYANAVARAFPRSQGGLAARQLAEQIKKPSVGIKVEKVNVINKPFRGLLSFKNIGVAYFRLVQLPASEQEDQGFYEDENSYWSRVTALKPIRSWKQQVPVIKDYRDHQAEIKIDGLSNGRYLLLVSADEGFSIDKNPMAATELYVSNISYVQSGEHLFVVNRDNGRPLAGARIQVWYSSYDYNKRRNVFSKAEQLTTDQNGYSKIKPVRTIDRSYGGMRLEISSAKDYLFMADALDRTFDGQPQKSQTNEAYELDHSKYYFFTDRSIYRPGQTLYFKAIGLTKNPSDGLAKLYKSGPVEVILRNANYEMVSSQTYLPNDYASISGNFLLPMTGLNGTFKLEIKSGVRTWSTLFKVEEYKRPKFFIEFPPLKGTYKLNKEITVTGMAKGYSGNSIDGAQVSFRVKRSTRFLYPWKFGFGRGGYWPPMERGEEMEITNGNTLTRPDGSFEITFTPISDLSIDPELDPGFDFTIEAVVTDINGEVRSEETTISIGYKSLVLNINAGNSLHQSADSTINVKVSATNLNGQPEDSKVKLVVYRLKNPDRLLRKRMWQAPDTFVLAKNEFEKHFPNDPYQNEDDFRNWESGQTVFSGSLETPTNSTISLAPGTLEPGYYKIEAITQDMDGKEVRTVDFVGVFNEKNGQLPSPSYLFDFKQNSTTEPGQQAVFWQATSIKDAFIIQQTIKKSAGGIASPEKDISSVQFIHQKDGFQRNYYDVKETDRGGYEIYRVLVFHNRIYIQQWRVNVPWTNKELNVSLETFREKLQPGDAEKWKVKISGAKGELAAAELLAGMYDASLDQFSPHTWQGINPWLNNNFYTRWNSGSNFSSTEGRQTNWYEPIEPYEKIYDNLIPVYDNNYYKSISGRAMGVQIRGVNSLDEVVVTGYGVSEKRSMSEPAPAPAAKIAQEDYDKVYTRLEDVKIGKEQTEIDNTGINIRKNFNETAFFFPELKTDNEGNISFEFTMPEALTQWKLQLLAHTTDARFAYASKNMVTQKQLMVIPNAPRFFRQGDNMELSVKISNLAGKELTGQAQLQLLNAATMQPVDGWFQNVFPSQYFTVAAGQSTALRFPIQIPYQFNDAVVYRITAKTNGTSDAPDVVFADGEESALPVLTNRILVTESFPLNLRGIDSKSFVWNRFNQMAADAERGSSLDHHSITLEYTTNPAWYAIQSLPYLMEYPFDCAEQTWNRFYANALAGKIANSSPRIKQIFESWKNKTPDALLSNLQKNQELKSALLEETPWVLQAKNEAEQKRNVGLLFDLVRMNNEAEAALNKLKELQGPNGGFMWFKGGHDDRYMTQYILTGIGHLHKLEAWPETSKQSLQNIIVRALPYADARIREEYEALVKSKTNLMDAIPSSFAVQYLYMRSFFPEKDIAADAGKAVQYFTEQATRKWMKMGKYEQGMIALALFRKNDKTTANSILSSITENSTTHEEFGMYWKEFNNPSFYWFQAPIESHALLMEAYHEIEGNVQRIDDLKTWLLKQKQTTNWKSTKATAEACYALLLRGTDWLSEERTVSVEMGTYTINSASIDKTEAGTGYFRHVISKEKINSGMGNIKVKMESPKESANKVSSSTSWGSVYWQYFEDLDRITPAETGVAIKKELYVIRNSDRGPVLEPVKEGDAIKVGDRIKVRVEIKNDRNMEYVHLKDMRASCFEPVNVLSGYRWQGGLGYYETTKDASSNFFIGYMPRGTYVFEYELRATMSGNFSNGITTMQCMYAPEFSTHSKGIRVNVEN
ncbi:MAG: MG2 domain-containing protein [Chitinophagaceae bacterium]|nr:MG2 domain-containing protein [Chitinophagaceae bacterium]